MTDKPRTRRVAIRKFSCPNHPDGPPTLPADGVEREELTLEQAYDENVLHGIKLAFDNETWGRHPDVEEARQALGLCCLGHEWKTVGYEEREIGAFDGMLLELGAGWQTEYAARNVLLAELAHHGATIENESGTVRIPLVSPEPEEKT